MSVLSVLFPGQFVDAFVYGDALYAWTSAGQIAHLPMRRIAEEAHRQQGMPRALAEAAFVDNRLFDGLEARDSFERDWAWEARDLGLAPIVTSDLGPISVYDMLITHFTLYVSTSEGLFSTRLAPRAYSPSVRDRPRLEQRIEGRVLGAAYSFGAIAMAVGRAGSWALVNEFDFTREFASGKRQLTDVSTGGVGWVGTTFYIQPEENLVRFFASDLRQGRKDPRRKNRMPRVLAGVTPLSEDVIDLPSIDALGSRGRLLPVAGGFALMVGGRLWVTPVGRWEGELVPRGVPALIAQIEERVWSVGETVGGFAVETASKVLALQQEGSLVALSEPVISLRAFPESRRYRRLVTATSERGLTVFFMGGIHPYPRDLRWHRGPDETREEIASDWGGPAFDLTAPSA